jgi:anti-sigma-K factor RskA
MSGAEDDPDLLAGEYVLGVLDAAGSAAVRLQAQADPRLAAAITDWQDRLAPLAALVAPVAPPPALWARIEAALPTPVATSAEIRPLLRAWRSAAVWRGTTAAALALAAAFAAVTFLRPAPPPPAVAVASLGPTGAPGSAFVAELAANGTVTLCPLAPLDVPSDRDLELWALPTGAARPVSLGVITAEGRRVTLPGLPASGTQLLVSLEPKGGSPTGQPTGPVVYGGRLTRVD